MSTSSLHPHGVFSAALTPLDAELAPDHARFVAHCRYLLSEGCDGIAMRAQQPQWQYGKDRTPPWHVRKAVAVRATRLSCNADNDFLRLQLGAEQTKQPRLNHVDAGAAGRRALGSLHKAGRRSVFVGRHA